MVTQGGIETGFERLPAVCKVVASVVLFGGTLGGIGIPCHDPHHQFFHIHRPERCAFPVLDRCCSIGNGRNICPFYSPSEMQSPCWNSGEGFLNGWRP